MYAAAGNGFRFVSLRDCHKEGLNFDFEEDEFVDFYLSPFLDDLFDVKADLRVVARPPSSPPLQNAPPALQ